MNICKYDGVTITPEMPSCCRCCPLYLEACMPVIWNGYLCGAECDINYCEYCPYFDECGA
ncbi:MAG: hypothetical protein J6C96_08030 [Oscillospiraceae bacterium]|nr:hypothetical protein [Oscillospiraceae bacterium]